MSLTALEEVQLKMMLKDREGCFGGLFLMLTIFALMSLVVIGFIRSIPLERRDASGQTYLCWVVSAEWPWQDQHRELVCVPEHHRIILKEGDK